MLLHNFIFIFIQHFHNYIVGIKFIKIVKYYNLFKITEINKSLI